MLSYRHGFHAGNSADVLKHLILCAVISYIRKKDKPFTIIDTHAGGGIYRLNDAMAEKTGEAEDGIVRVEIVPSDEETGLWYVCCDGDFLGETGDNGFEEPVVIQNYGCVVKIAHTLQVINLLSYIKPQPFMKPLVNHKLRKYQDTGVIFLLVPGSRFFETFDHTDGKIRPPDRPVDHDNTFAVYALHISDLGELFHRPADRISGTSILLYHRIFRRQTGLRLIDAFFNFPLQVFINSAVFLCRHGVLLNMQPRTDMHL